MKIGNIELKNKLILSPMAGVNDVGFRTVCVESGADYAETEMVSAKALKHKSKRTQDMLVTSDKEVIKVVQIFGSDPKVMAEICQSEYLQKFDIIDINMGCPATKITGNGEGSALMSDINLAREVVLACVNATKKPVTVKFRKGWDDESVNAVEFAKMCEEAGAAAVTVHARTKQQKYSGFSDLDIIRQVKNAVKIPVIGNGDVVDLESYQKMITETGCDAVMIGRGALGNPGIFSIVMGKEPKMTRYEYLERHVSLLQKHQSNSYIVKHMRKHFLWYLTGVPHSAEVKTKIVTLTDLNKVMSLLKETLKDSI